MSDRISNNTGINVNIPVGNEINNAENLNNAQNIQNVQNEQNGQNVGQQNNQIDHQQIINNVNNDEGLNNFINGANNGNNLNANVEGRGNVVLHEVHDPNLPNPNQIGPNEVNPNNEQQVVNQPQNQPVGKEWDFSKAEGLKDLVKNSYDKIKSDIKADKNIDDLKTAIFQKFQAVTGKNAQLNAQLQPILEHLLEKFSQLKDARNKLCSGLPDSKTLSSDPKEALAQMRKFLRVFRYDTQKCLLSIAPNGTQKMGVLESGLRGLQNLFTFGIDHHVTKDEINKVCTLDREIGNLLTDFNNIVEQANEAPVATPTNFKLMSTINNTLEISHRTNDQVRLYQQRSDDYTRINEILGPAVNSGGSRKVEFTVGVGVLVGLGFPETVTAGVKAGARFTVTADVKGTGKGNPVSVTFRLAGGLEAKLLVKAGDEEKTFTGGKLQAGGGAQLSSFTTRTYASLDDFIADASRNKLATTRSFGMFLWSGIKYAAGKLGQFGSWLGRHSGDTLHSNAQYFNALKTRGYIDQVDGILAAKSNAVILSEQTGLTIKGSLDASAGMSFFDKMLEAKASVSGSMERDFNVKSQFYAPVVKMLKNIPERNDLAGMIRNDPVSGQPAQLPNDEDDLEQTYANLIRDTKANPPQNDQEWQVFANKVRTLMICTEIRVLDGQMSRELADKLQGRFSNPEIKIPVDIYREFFMEGSGLAKPAKIRKNFSLKAEASAFKPTTDGLTNGLKGITDNVAGNIAKNVADGTISQARKDIGLDSSISYKYSSEKPANNDDPRPWENVTKTHHEIVVSQNMLFNTIINAVHKISANHKTIETEHRIPRGGLEAGKTATKDVGEGFIRSLLIAGVKESAKAAVMKYVSNTDNMKGLLKFINSQENLSYQGVLGIVSKLALDPKLKLDSKEIQSYVSGGDIAYTNEKTKSVKWSYVDGELEMVTVSSTDTTKFGISEEPLGVGLGLSFDISLSVSETIKDKAVTINTSMTTLLERTETYMSQSSFNSDTCEGVKTWMAKNITAVRKLIPLNTKSDEVINKAIEATDDPDVRAKINLAKTAVTALNENSTDNEVVNTFHNLAVLLTHVFRAKLPNIGEQAQQPQVQDQGQQPDNVNNGENEVQVP